MTPFDFRRASARLTAGLVRIAGPARLDLAEDATQEAMLRALRVWPLRGAPDDPEAWLFTAARNALFDRLRAETAAKSRTAEVARSARTTTPPAEDALEREDEPLADDALRMLFLCCSPQLPPESRTALALKECCGFGVNEIAAAFRAEPEAVAQRIVRAKRRLREGDVRFETPGSDELPARREDVRGTIYALFNEGWRPAFGDAVERRESVAEALRLTAEFRRTRAGDDPATAALHALLLFHAARMPARTGDDGVLLALADQDRARFDRSLLAAGFAAFSASCRGDEETRWHVEASIASLHAAAPSFAETDWAAVLERYDRLLRLVPTPIVRLNRAVAAGMARGPETGLTLLAAKDVAEELADYAPAAASTAYFLGAAGRHAEAATAWTKAAALATNGAERAFYLARARGAAMR